MCVADTIPHILCECPVACQLWGSGNVLHGNSFVDFVESKLRAADLKEGITMVARFWVMWMVRNDAVWNGKQWQVSEMRQYVDMMLASWCEVWHSGSKSVQQQAAGITEWVPPLVGYLKYNIDAATHVNGASFGVVIRNHRGVFIATLSGSFPRVHDSYLAEALAFKEALSWIKSQSVDRCFLESDCLNFVSSFISVRHDYSYIGLIIKQCRCIASDIGNILVRHVRRSANHVAHVLTRATSSSSVLRS